MEIRMPINLITKWGSLFFERHMLRKPTQEDIDYMKSPIGVEEIKFTVENVPIKETSSSEISLMNFISHLRNK